MICLFHFPSLQPCIDATFFHRCNHLFTQHSKSHWYSCIDARLHRCVSSKMTQNIPLNDVLRCTSREIDVMQWSWHQLALLGTSYAVPFLSSKVCCWSWSGLSIPCCRAYTRWGTGSPRDTHHSRSLRRRRIPLQNPLVGWPSRSVMVFHPH